MSTGAEIKTMLERYDPNGNGFLTLSRIRFHRLLDFGERFDKLLECLADDDGNVMINKAAGKFIQSHKNLIQQLAIRDGAFGACYLRGLPAAGSLCSPLPLALTLKPHNLSSTIKISNIVLFRFLASGGPGGAPKSRTYRLI